MRRSPFTNATIVGYWLLRRTGRLKSRKSTTRGNRCVCTSSATSRVVLSELASSWRSGSRRSDFSTMEHSRERKDGGIITHKLQFCQIRWLFHLLQDNFSSEPKTAQPAGYQLAPTMAQAASRGNDLHADTAVGRPPCELACPASDQRAVRRVFGPGRSGRLRPGTVPVHCVG